MKFNKLMTKVRYLYLTENDYQGKIVLKPFYIHNFISSWSSCHTLLTNLIIKDACNAVPYLSLNIGLISPKEARQHFLTFPLFKRMEVFFLVHRVVEC